MSLIEKIDKTVDKVKVSLDSISKKEADKKKGKVTKLADEIERLNKELENSEAKVVEQKRKLESNEKKVKRYVKDIKKYKKRDKVLSEKVENLQRSLGVVESRLEKQERVSKNFRGREKEYKEVIAGLEKEVKEFEKRVNYNKENGKDVPRLEKELEEQAEKIRSLEEDKELLEKSKLVQKKKLRRHINGEKRAKEREIVKNELLMKDLWSVNWEYKKSEHLIRQKEGLLKDKEAELVSIRRAFYEYRNDVVSQIEKLSKVLNKDTYVLYTELGSLVEKYERIVREVKEEDNFKRDDIGYILEEEDNRYFISLGTGTTYKVTGSREDLRDVKEGDVCKVKVYRDGNVKIAGVYSSDKVKRMSHKDKRKVLGVRKTRGKKKGLGKGFTDAVYKYNTLIITSKNIRNYREYFNRYSFISVVDPFSEGDAEIKRKVLKADIVVVRTDAVSHNITDYLKKEKKDDTVFLYNATIKEVAYEISSKALKKSGKVT